LKEAVLSGALIAALLLNVSSIRLADFDSQSARGWHRGGLALSPDHKSELQMTTALTTEKGALAFWVRPDMPVVDPQGSYTLVSARWGSPSEGYFAISQGWWEPLGQNRFHAVISNQDAAFCVADRALAAGRWTHVVVSWRGTAPGYCRIYFDGEKSADSPMAVVRPRQATPLLALGSDRESPDRRQRETRGTLDELEYFPAGVTDAQVRTLYQRAVPGSRQRLARAFEWALPYRVQHQEAPAPKTELRALFDESWQWARSANDVKSLVDVARRAGFNVIVACVWHGAGSVWPSRFAHRQPGLAAPPDDFDALQALIELAHQAHIEVHPWFTVVRREDARHPEWFDDGTPADAYDVHKPAFRRFAAALTEEVAARYAVDGIHLDYVRAMGICRSKSCADSYAAHSGRDLLADLPASTVRGPARDAIERWQDSAVRELVSDISRRVRATRPGARITVSGHPVPRETLRALQGRAEMDWLAEGLIDAVFAMEYGAVPRHENFTAVAREVADPSALVWVFANFDRIDGIATARPAANLAEYIRFARSHTPGSGIALYIRAMLNPAQIDALAFGPFRERVPPRWPQGTAP
jgi:Glycosyl hydrolase-like 10/Concanavalin A-like lectin/glucanases superfamily